MNTITLSVKVHSKLMKTWVAYTDPEHIQKWNFANQDWHCPSATTDLRIGGKFSYEMAAKDGSMAFSYRGMFNMVEKPNQLRYHLTDGRMVDVRFDGMGSVVVVTVTFEIDDEQPYEQQEEGWKAILDNFKRYVNRL